MKVNVPANKQYEISGNNMDGVIVTVQEEKEVVPFGATSSYIRKGLMFLSVNRYSLSNR